MRLNEKLLPPEADTGISPGELQMIIVGILNPEEDVRIDQTPNPAEKSPDPSSHPHHNRLKPVDPQKPLIASASVEVRNKI